MTARKGPLDRLREIAAGYQPVGALAAAVEVGLLGRLARGPAAPSALARACRASPRGVRMLSGALVGLGFLGRRRERYFVRSPWRRLLDPGRRGFAGALFLSARRTMRAFTELPEAIRRGRPVHELDEPREGARFFRRLVPALHLFNRRSAERAAKVLRLAGLRRPFRVLDVAAGSGVWGVAAARASRHVRVDALDLPGVLPPTRRFAREAGVAPRFRFLPGDLRRADFGRSRYDLVILGHICHSEGPVRTRRLFRAVSRALVPGGRLLIAEFLADDGRRGPPQSLLFALVMLVHTKEGDVYTVGEIRRWLREAGFGSPRVLPDPPRSPLLLARAR